MFERTVEWAIEQGIETATFHILTPYPGTALYRRMSAQGRHHASTTGICYDTRHAVFRPARMSADELERGYLARLSRVLPLERRSCAARRRTTDLLAGLRHLAYAAGLEEVRAAVGFRHPRQTGRDDAAGARDDPQRVRPTDFAERPCAVLLARKPT